MPVNDMKREGERESGGGGGAEVAVEKEREKIGCWGTRYNRFAE